MSIETHIETISQKRAALKAHIAQEMAHPHPDLTRISALKKLNLRLKEEMLHCFNSLKKVNAS